MNSLLAAGGVLLPHCTNRVGATPAARVPCGAAFRQPAQPPARMHKRARQASPIRRRGAAKVGGRQVPPPAAAAATGGRSYQPAVADRPQHSPSTKLCPVGYSICSSRGSSDSTLQLQQLGS
jgi:hypothetical protein